jgi:transposase-like protein
MPLDTHEDAASVEPSFSTDGPTCPHCKATYTPDEGFYFDQNGYEMECDGCGEKFSVQPDCSWSWVGRPIAK